MFFVMVPGQMCISHIQLNSEWFYKNKPFQFLIAENEYVHTDCRFENLITL